MISVADGDTFTLLTAEEDQVQIRLSEIDAPERGQPYGNRSRQLLSGLVFNKSVRVEVQTTDRYGRIVGRPYAGEIDVCREMVRQGGAWAYRRYIRDQELLRIEKEARQASRGLWSTTEAQSIPPWEWRTTAGSESAPQGCKIKGNISNSGERIYHVPGSIGYGSTRIDTDRGERWFCSEEEAQAAGWRAPRR